MPLRIVVVSHKYGNVAFSWNSHEKKKLLINFLLAPVRVRDIIDNKNSLSMDKSRCLICGATTTALRKKPRKSHLSHTHTHLCSTLTLNEKLNKDQRQQNLRHC